MRRTTTAVLLMLLCACQPAFIDGVPNEDSPYFVVPVDSQFALKRAVTVLARDDSAYFQDGKSPTWYDVDIYGSWCVLQLESKRDAVQLIEPDRFTVIKVSTERRFYMGREAPPARTMFAARRRIATSADIGIGDAQAYEVEATIMQLRSARHPQVRRLICAKWGIPQGGTFLTVRQIRHTLGEFFDLELATRSR
jgi:hypothetical protein